MLPQKKPPNTKETIPKLATMHSCCTKSQNPEKHKSQRPFFFLFFFGLLTNHKKPKNRNSSSMQPGRYFFFWTQQKLLRKPKNERKSFNDFQELDFCFVFFEGNLLRECQMKHCGCLLGKAVIVHSFSTPPKMYPTWKQYQRKTKDFWHPLLFNYISQAPPINLKKKPKAWKTINSKQVDHLIIWLMALLSMRLRCENQAINQPV